MKNQNTVKPTQEEKEQYFAAHWGQKIGKCISFHNNVVSAISKNNISSIDYLELTSLADITDKLLIKAYHIHSAAIGYDYTQDFAPVIDMAKHWLKNDGIGVFSKYGALRDFVRSNGYAVDWSNYTVDQIISFGWLKLKQKGGETNG